MTSIINSTVPEFKASAYHNGWARGGGIKSDSAPYGLPLELKHNGAEKLGGPLFWAQYSHIGLDPRNLSDRYANYWNVVRNHALSNYRYCVENPKQYKGYGEDCWGLDRQPTLPKAMQPTARATTTMVSSHRQQPCPVFPTHRRNPCVH